MNWLNAFSRQFGKLVPISISLRHGAATTARSDLCQCQKRDLSLLAQAKRLGNSSMSGSRSERSHYQRTALEDKCNFKDKEDCCFKRDFNTSTVFRKTKDEVHKGDKVLRVKLKSTRLDAVLKAGLTMSRNKIEKAFYDDRIRINGVRPIKKSQVIGEGDEIDVVRGYNELNPNFIDVNRVEISDLGEGEDDDSDASGSDSDNEDRIPAVLKRSKMLTIKNYSPPWRGSSSDN